MLTPLQHNAVDVVGVMNHMRRQRSTMVQTEDQVLRALPIGGAPCSVLFPSQVPLAFPILGATCSTKMFSPHVKYELTPFSVSSYLAQSSLC